MYNERLIVGQGDEAMQTPSIPISALQHYAFCPRQCAYIHIEQAWVDNYLTAKGAQLHERVHGGDAETRSNVRSERGVQVCSEKLGVHGLLDLLEIERDSGSVMPIEYKKGKPKIDDCDRIQLCAQAMCLEEMTSCRIEKAAIWYWQVRRREWIDIDDTLRESTIATINETKKLFDTKKLPKAIYSKLCKSCSFFDKCSPQHKDHSNTYVEKIFHNEEIT